MGVPGERNQRAFEREAATVNDYFPHRVTIRRGDSVRFLANGFHTVDIPVRGQDIEPVFVPTGTVSGAVDAAGAAVWFNGQAQIGFNQSLFRSQFGRRVTHDPATRFQSGLPLQDPPKALTVRFRRTGTVTYFCDIHPGMKGIVRVVDKRRDVPSAAADRRAQRRQISSRLALAKRLARKTTPSGIVNVGVAGAGGVERMQFAPSTMTVNRGTTLRFRMSPGSFEAHTATTGPGDPSKPEPSYLRTLAASFASPAVDPIAVYPSDPPPVVATLTGASHGNAFWNSGVMDRDNRSQPPSSNAVTFGEAGTFTFYCLIHPDMKATVNVR